MQGFNMGRYRPPDADPRRDAFNTTHPLGARARKLATEGVLIVRFELPFHVWCDGCAAHVAQGRRFNAEKRHVDDYLGTKIWAFRCKCTCSAWFEIRTDPQHARYIVHHGARQQHQHWDPSEHGGHPIYDTDPPPNAEAGKDAFAKIDADQQEKKGERERRKRIAQLEQLADRTWADPYARNVHLRHAFRKQKRSRTEQLHRDVELRDRIGWNHDRSLLPSSPATDEKDRREWSRQQSTASTSSASKKPPARDKAKALSAAQRLQARLVANTRKRSASLHSTASSRPPS